MIFIKHINHTCSPWTLYLSYLCRRKMNCLPPPLLKDATARSLTPKHVSGPHKNRTHGQVFPLCNQCWLSIRSEYADLFSLAGASGERACRSRFGAPLSLTEMKWIRVTYNHTAAIPASPDVIMTRVYASVTLKGSLSQHAEWCGFIDKGSMAFVVLYHQVSVKTDIHITPYFFWLCHISILKMQWIEQSASLLFQTPLSLQGWGIALK